MRQRTNNHQLYKNSNRYCTMNRSIIIAFQLVFQLVLLFVCTTNLFHQQPLFVNGQQVLLPVVTPPPTIAPMNNIFMQPVTTPGTTTTTTTNGYKCFTSNIELRDAVLQWTNNTSTNNKLPSSIVSQTYGYPIGNWCVGYVTDFTSIFANISNFTGLNIDDISNWNTSAAITFRNMFNNCINFEGSLTGWDTSNAIDMSGMFANTYRFDNTLSNFNTAKVIDMSYMFYYSIQFTGSTGLINFQTNMVQNMSNMFNGAFVFNSDLNMWDTSNVKDMSSMLANTALFNSKLFTNTSKVQDMSYMFSNTSTFNDIGQSLTLWDVSRVIRMNGMFLNAISYTSNSIQNWKTLSVQDYGSMFRGATSFALNLCSWNTAITGLNTLFPQLPNTFNMFLNTSCPVRSDPAKSVTGTTNQTYFICYPCSTTTTVAPAIIVPIPPMSVAPVATTSGPILAVVTVAPVAVPVVTTSGPTLPTVSIPTIAPSSLLPTETAWPTITAEPTKQPVVVIPTTTSVQPSNDIFRSDVPVAITLSSDIPSSSSKSVSPTVGPTTAWPTITSQPTSTYAPTNTGGTEGTLRPSITRTPSITPHPTKRIVTRLPTNISYANRGITSAIISVGIVFVSTTLLLLLIV